MKLLFDMLALRKSNKSSIRPEEGRLPAPFVVGVGRSGTTMLRLMLDAHPDLAIPPETHFLYKLSKLRSRGKTLKRDFTDILLNTRSWADFHIAEDDLCSALSTLKPFRVDEGIRLFYRLYADRFQKNRWGDKTPGYVLRMKAIHGLLPEARFIHIIRDGRDVALSRIGLHFGPGEDIVSEANDWRNKIISAREQALSLPHYLEVKYEALVEEPESCLKKVCEFLELDFAKEMLSYHETASERIGEVVDLKNQDGTIDVDREKRISIHAKTSSSPDKSRVCRWRTEMSQGDLDQYAEIAGDLLKDLGYEV